jgi:hypothetical protein
MSRKKLRSWKAQEDQARVLGFLFCARVITRKEKLQTIVVDFVLSSLR